jgi:hypothetical protein
LIPDTVVRLFLHFILAPLQSLLLSMHLLWWAQGFFYRSNNVTKLAPSNITHAMNVPQRQDAQDSVCEFSCLGYSKQVDSLIGVIALVMCISLHLFVCTQVTRRHLPLNKAATIKQEPTGW